MKQITISGNVGKDAETRTTQGGDSVTSWSVAVKDRSTKEGATIWFDVSLWGKRGETLGQFIGKGSAISVSGDLGTREHNGKTYLTVKADQVTLLGGGQTEGRAKDPDPARQAADRKTPAGGRNAMDDEIPF